MHLLSVSLTYASHFCKVHRHEGQGTERMTRRMIAERYRKGASGPMHGGRSVCVTLSEREEPGGEIGWVREPNENQGGRPWKGEGEAGMVA